MRFGNLGKYALTSLAFAGCDGTWSSEGAERRTREPAHRVVVEEPQVTSRTVKPGEGLIAVLRDLLNRSSIFADSGESSLTTATRIYKQIPKDREPNLKAGDTVTLDPDGLLSYQPLGKAPIELLRLRVTRKIPTEPSVKSREDGSRIAAKPGTAPVAEFNFSPQHLRDPKNQTASYEDFRSSLQAAKDAGLTQETVAKQLFGDRHLNRMFTYSDNFANKNLKGVEAELRELSDLRWQQIAAYYSVFGSGTELTGECKPFEGFTQSCLPKIEDLAKNHQDALDAFFPKGSPNPEIYAVQGGVVVAAADDWKDGRGGLGGKSGNGVVLATPVFEADKCVGYMLTHYYHLSKVTVKVGDFVKPGDLLGEGGRTGFNADKEKSPSHLHFAGHQVILETPEADSRHEPVHCLSLHDVFSGKTTLPKVYDAFLGSKF